MTTHEERPGSAVKSNERQSKQECVRMQTTAQLGDSPAEDLLSETLEWLLRKWLGENVRELFLGVNSLDLNVFGEV